MFLLHFRDIVHDSVAHKIYIYFNSKLEIIFQYLTKRTLGRNLSSSLPLKRKGEHCVPTLLLPVDGYCQTLLFHSYSLLEKLKRLDCISGFTSPMSLLHGWFRVPDHLITSRIILRCVVLVTGRGQYSKNSTGSGTKVRRVMQHASFTCSRARFILLA